MEKKRIFPRYDTNLSGTTGTEHFSLSTRQTLAQFRLLFKFNWIQFIASQINFPSPFLNPLVKRLLIAFRIHFFLLLRITIARRLSSFEWLKSLQKRFHLSRNWKLGKMSLSTPCDVTFRNCCECWIRKMSSKLQHKEFYPLNFFFPLLSSSLFSWFMVFRSFRENSLPHSSASQTSSTTCCCLRMNEIFFFVIFSFSRSRA